jgi:hypothetical protein
VILTGEVLEGIRRGAITCAFRRWRRPSVKSGGTLLTAAGQLEIRAVVPIHADDISDAEARRAGYASRQALVAELDQRAEGALYRIDLGTLRADPRVALRARAELTDEERARRRARLDRLDSGAPEGPWTRRTLEAIRDHSGLRAADLCRQVGQDGLPFKINVRKLKALGLTESLEVGYRLSPRGHAVLAAWEAHRAGRLV